MKRLLPLVLLLAACTSAPTQNGGTTDVLPDTVMRDGIAHNSAEAEKFIVRNRDFSAGLIDYVDPRRATLTSRSLSAESVVFRLDQTGDTNEFHKAAIERAAELAVNYAWPAAMIEQEQDREGHLAYVRIESVGMPTGATRGTMLPVRIVCLGDAADIRGGYLYPTPLKNSLGRTIAFFEGGYLPAPHELPGEREGKPIKNPLIDARGKQVVDPETKQPMWEEALERRQSLGRVSYILREGFRIAATVPDEELSSESIELPMDRIIDAERGKYFLPVSADMIPELIRGVESAMAERGIKVRAATVGTRSLVVTPLGVREKTLKEIFDELQLISITFKPRNSVIIVFDDERQRVVLYGPVERRFLFDDVTLGTDPFTVDAVDAVTRKPRPPQQLPFRVTCRLVRRASPGKSGKYGIPTQAEVDAGIVPDGDKGAVRLSWTLQTQELDREGEIELPSSDISDILRYLFAQGMGPREVVGFCVVAKDKPALLAELGFNPRRFRDPENPEGR